MDPVTLIEAALAAGAASAVQDEASPAVKRAYERLTGLARRRLAGGLDGELVLTRHETAPQIWREPLIAGLSAQGADSDLELIASARALMELLDSPWGQPEDGAVNVHGSQGVLIGPNGIQNNNTHIRADTYMNNQQAPGFCPCGNPVTCQCQFCQAGLCGECDVIEWRTSRKGEMGGNWAPPPPPLLVPTGSRGYLVRLETWSDASSAAWWVDGRQIIRTRRAAAEIVGPFVYADKVLPGMRAASGEIRHACCGCLTDSAIAAVEAIIDGRACRTPKCAHPATMQCRCCGGRFCDAHKGGPYGFTLQMLCGNSSEWVEWKSGPGFCVTCIREQRMQLQRIVMRKFDEWGVAERGEAFEIPSEGTMVPWIMRAKRSAAREKAERVGAELVAVVNGLPQPAASCANIEWFGDRESIRVTKKMIPMPPDSSGLIYSFVNAQ